MIRLTIYDDDFPGTLKEMQVSVEPVEFVPNLFAKVSKAMTDLIKSWWTYRNKTEEEIYDEPELKMAYKEAV